MLETRAVRAAEHALEVSPRDEFNDNLIANVHPPIDGLREAGYLTNETVFNLTELPRRLLVIGGGPIGCELAQAFCRLGSEVTLVEMGEQLLSREDREAAEILARSLERDGVQIRLSASVKRVTGNGPAKVVCLESGGGQETISVDEILVGAGRAPNVEGLNLEVVGVEYNYKKGVVVNDHLQTTNPCIYAAGDVCLQYKFTHTADAAADAYNRTRLTPFVKGLLERWLAWAR